MRAVLSFVTPSTLTVLSVCCCLHLALAAPCNITLSPGDDWSTLVTAGLAGASSPDAYVICFFPGEYKGGCGSGAPLTSAGGGPVTVRREPNATSVASEVLIDCEGAGRAFVVNVVFEAVATIQDIHIMNGSHAIGPQYGGAIHVDGPLNLTLSRVTVSACSDSDIFNIALFANGDAVLSVFNSTFMNNTAGGIRLAIASSLRIHNSLFVGNSGSNGAGLLSYASGGVFIDGCRFEANSVTVHGAGICVYTGEVSVTNTIFKFNSASQYGGGVFAFNAGTVDVANCEFVDNYAFARGGALATYGPAVVTDCVVNGNSASSGGAGLAAETGADMVVKRVNVTGNATPLSGGGLYAQQGVALHIEDCVIANNNAGTLGFTAKGGGVYVAYTPASFLGNNTITGNSVTTRGGGVALHVAGEVNISPGTVLRGNTALLGGGLCVSGGSSAVRVTGAVIEGNVAGTAGGVYVSSRSVFTYFVHCVISSNTATGLGGGMSVRFVHLSNTTVAHNVAVGQHGGGLYVANGPCRVTSSSSVVGNTAQRGGGGIYVINDHLELTDSFVSDNTAVGENGGGVSVRQAIGSATISRCVIRNNTAVGGSGGGVASTGGAALVLVNLTVSANTAAGGSGGGLFLAGDSLVIDGSSIEGNNATQSGGGLAVGDDTNPIASVLSLVMSQITNNVANSSGGAVFGYANATLNATVIVCNEATVVHASVCWSEVVPNAGGVSVCANSTVHVDGNSTLVSNLVLNDAPPSTLTRVVNYIASSSSYISLASGSGGSVDAGGATECYGDSDCAVPHECLHGGDCLDPNLRVLQPNTTSCNCSSAAKAAGFPGGDVCQYALCGDGIVAGTEQCDDGNNVNGDGCENSCERTCGNGVVDNATEVCDDGNNVDGDGCAGNCSGVEPFFYCPLGGGACVAVCGDRVVVSGEACDDGNSVDDDVCSNNCTLNCGNGVVDAANNETCDDGNTVDTDNCTNSCQLPPLANSSLSAAATAATTATAATNSSVVGSTTAFSSSFSASGTSTSDVELMESSADAGSTGGSGDDLADTEAGARRRVVVVSSVSAAAVACVCLVVALMVFVRRRGKVEDGESVVILDDGVVVSSGESGDDESKRGRVGAVGSSSE